MRHIRLLFVLIVVTVLAACQQDPTAVPESASTNSGQGFTDPVKGPVHTGYILGKDGETPVKIKYQVINGTAIFDGDIGIGPASEVAKTPEEALRNNRHHTSRALRDTRVPAWPGGVVPVVKTYNTTNLQAALNQIQQQVPGITFVAYNGQSRYLAIENGQGSNYYDGCRGAKCTVFVGKFEASKAVIMHEIGHALGFAHEVRRCDRDGYIRLVNTNPYPAEFAKSCEFTQMGGYDLESIMHYNSREFGQLHFTNLSGGEVNGYWGRQTLSGGDVAAWRQVYPGGSSGTSVTGTTANQGEYTGPYNLRSGPGTSNGVVGSVNGGVSVTITCQATGTSHTGPWGTTNLWDKLSTGGWISDAFVYTGSNSTVAPPCS